MKKKEFNLKDQLANFLSITVHPTAYEFLHSEALIRAIIKGNQGGATTMSMYDLTMRLLNIHPVHKLNAINAPIRCISKSKIMGKDDISNQQYIEFKRIFPYEQIKRDITSRASTMIVKNPTGGADYKVEFLSIQQELSAFMSVQRQSIYQDEEISKEKWDENQMRLLRFGGDTVLTITPAMGMDWTFDEIWRRADKIYRSKTISDLFSFPRVEVFNIGSGIEIFNWATDDNPALTPDYIEKNFENIVEESDLAMRRYGVMKQSAGIIYKMFDIGIHRIPAEKYFDGEKFKRFWQYRVIDYHPVKPWAITWMACSPQNEWFVWNEWLANHDRMSLEGIKDEIKKKSLVEEEDDFNRCTLVDPLAKSQRVFEQNQRQGHNIFDNLRLGEGGLKRLREADTKNENGHLAIKLRLSNSVKCEVPFNNYDKDFNDPVFKQNRPTLWFMDTCRNHIDSFRNWRVAQNDNEVGAMKKTRRAIQKWSDFCRNMEYLANLNPVHYKYNQFNNYIPKKYFNNQVRANA